MSNLDDLAKAAEEAEAANVHDRPVTDADLGETATEGAQVVIDGAPPTPVVPVMPAAAPMPEMQLPQPVAQQPEQQSTVTVQAPEEPVAPLPSQDHTPQLTPFSDQITKDTAPTLQPIAAQPQPALQQPQPMQQMQQMEQPSAPPASGTMPGQTVRPQTVTPQSHIIPESFPKPATGADPLSGIAV